MRGSFDKAYVLYAPVEEIGGEGRLLRACRILTLWSTVLFLFSCLVILSIRILCTFKCSLVFLNLPRGH